MPPAKTIQGDSLIYYFLRELVEAKDEGTFVVPQSIIQEMIRATAIWLPLNVYAQVPTFLPHIIRDPSCRGNKVKGLPDKWNAPNALGYVRDDNSRLKGLPRSLPVSAPADGKLQGARMGNEFVASHIWRETNNEGTLASRDPLLNSFVPNLVWLPRQISKLSDREGGVVQRTLQSMSWDIYRRAFVADHLKPVVEETWTSLPQPAPLARSVDHASLNWFVADESFVLKRTAKIQGVIDALVEIEAGSLPAKKFESARYVDGITQVSTQARRQLVAHLRRYVS